MQIREPISIIRMSAGRNAMIRLGVTNGRPDIRRQIWMVKISGSLPAVHVLPSLSVCCSRRQSCASCACETCDGAREPVCFSPVFALWRFMMFRDCQGTDFQIPGISSTRWVSMWSKIFPCRRSYKISCIKETNSQRRVINQRLLMRSLMATVQEEMLPRIIHFCLPQFISIYTGFDARRWKQPTIKCTGSVLALGPAKSSNL